MLTVLRTHVGCEWCGRMVRIVYRCPADYPIGTVCLVCRQELEHLDAEAARGGILRWSGPYSLGRRSGRSW